MSAQTAKGPSPLIAFEAQIAELCNQDKYREMAESFTSFVKEHNGINYLAFEPLPAKIGDHLVKKTHAPSAFMTLTLRHPTWTTELSQKLQDPAAFETFVKSLEADVIEIAGQTKKIH